MRRILILLMSAVLWVSGIAVAQDYPERVDPYVNDYASLLSPAEEEALRNLVAQIAPDFDLTILTIRATSDYDPSLPSMETFATKLFNEWGIGSAEENTGVLILIVLTEQSVRIELGDGYGSQYNDAMQQVIDDAMTPYFSEGEVAEGLDSGVRQLYREITGQPLGGTTSLFERMIIPVVSGIRQVLAQP